MITRRGFFGSMLALPGLLGLRGEIAALRSALAMPTDVPDDDLTQFVKIKIGTGGHGHTYPGATVPFGMVQLSPDTCHVLNTLQAIRQARETFGHQAITCYIISMSHTLSDLLEVQFFFKPEEIFTYRQNDWKV